jgi:hypothetical protein
MSLIETWLQPLRDYPRWFVLLSFMFVAGVVIWVIAKLLKWSIYAAGLVVFATITGAFALWLWA